MKPFFTDQPEWADLIGRIYVSLERVTLLDDQAPHRLELRRRNRIRSVHSSTAIEGNRLTEGEVRTVVNGSIVFGPEKDIKEVQNAWASYEAIDSFDPYCVDSFLRAHAMMTEGLIRESGMWRTGDAEVTNEANEVLHTGADPGLVPEGMKQLFQWAQATNHHPLIASSATHYMIEFIHPCQDGNGRMGRLWQTLILSRWNPLFAWMPTETLVRDRQLGYYTALQASHDLHIDASPFITYMLGVIDAALLAYQQSAVAGAEDEGVNEGVNEGVKPRIDSLDREILNLLREDSTRTVEHIATIVDRSRATVERRISRLKSRGDLQRLGSDKTGVWIVKKGAE